MTASDKMKRFGVMLAYDYLDRDPENNIPKLVDWLERFDTKKQLEPQLKIIRDVINDPNSNWYKLIYSLWKDIDDDVRKATFENFVINASMIGIPAQRQNEARYGCNIPWAILMDPTSACNLRCTGCWAAEYGNGLSLSFDELDSIIEQGKDIGVHFYLYSGGEPLVRKKDIIALCNKHPDCQFLAFTNGTLIDEEFADDMLRVKNFIPAISAEGFEDDTESRRGNGTFKGVERAMAILKGRKLPFGISCCYTSKNVKTIGSEEYFDQMVGWGAKFCWFFTYMPVGAAASPELMVSAEQREFMYNRVREFRKTKPIFTLDFWNDGEFVKGCIAGGRSYLHINANGDFEPCAFIHYSDSNLRESTLLEALQSPLFMAYREGQPFNANYLRPCPLLDNPGALTDMVEHSGAHSTEARSPEDVRDLSAKCVEKAADWAVTADRLWSCRDCHGGGCKVPAEEASPDVKRGA